MNTNFTLDDVLQEFLTFKLSNAWGFLSPVKTEEWIASKNSIGATKFMNFWEHSINGIMCEYLSDPLSPTSNLLKKLDVELPLNFLLNIDFKKVLHHTNFNDFSNYFVEKAFAPKFKESIEINTIYPILVLGKSISSLAPDVIGSLQNLSHMRQQHDSFEHQDFKWNICKAILDFCVAQEAKELTQTQFMQVLDNTEYTLKKHAPDFYRAMSFILTDCDNDNVPFSSLITIIHKEVLSKSNLLKNKSFDNFAEAASKKDKYQVQKKDLLTIKEGYPTAPKPIL